MRTIRLNLLQGLLEIRRYLHGVSPTLPHHLDQNGVLPIVAGDAVSGFDMGGDLSNIAQIG